MIKKLVWIVFSVFFVFSSMATNVVVDDEALKKHVNEMVSEDNRVAVVNAFAEILKSNGNNGYSRKNFLEICAVAGWDITKEDGKKNCDYFVQALVNDSAVDFYAVCGKDKGKTGKNEQCINVFKDVRVDHRAAVKLPVLYAKTKLNKTIKCSNKREDMEARRRQDYIKCTSVDNNSYYEFEFDNADEANDRKRRLGVAEAVCEGIYDVNFRARGCSHAMDPMLSASINPSNCWNDACRTDDEAVCKNINNSLQAMGGMSAKIGKDGCEVSFKVITDSKDLKRIDGIDPFAFCGDIQIRANAGLDLQVEDYVRSKMGGKLKTFSCLALDSKYIGGGCTTKMGNSWSGDDVLRCTVNNSQEVDFVFDDLSETWKNISDGGYQAISCISSDGSFDGKRCQGVNEKGCEEVKKASKQACPECKDVYWDKDRSLCVLPTSASATNLQKGLRIAGTTGMVVGAVALTVFSGGTATGVWVIVADVATIAGGSMVIAADVAMTYGIYTEEVASKLNTCLNKTGDEGTKCAKELLQELLRKMQSYKKELTDAESKSLDEAFAGLFAKIPPEDDFWKWLDNPKIWTCYGTETCVINTEMQVWQAVKLGGGITMAVGSLMKVFALKDQSVKQLQRIKGKRANIEIRDMKQSGMRVAWEEKGIVGNEFLKKNPLTIGGKVKRFTTNNDLKSYLMNLGYKVGDVVPVEYGGKLVSVVVETTGVSFNPGALLGVAVGSAATIQGKDKPIAVKRPEIGQNPNQQETPVEVPVQTDVPTQGVVPEIGQNPNQQETPVEVPVQTDVSTQGVVPEIEQNPNQQETPVEVPVQTDVSTQGVKNKDDRQNTVTHTPYETSSKKTGISGLGAVAIGAGVAGLGVGTALLVAGKKSDKSAGVNTVNTNNVVNTNADLYDNIKLRANGILGYVNNSAIELVSIETINGTKEKIVGISGRAVIVVKQRNNIIPFVVDVINGVMQWVPFTNVDEKTGAFSKYIVPAGDAFGINQISGKLNEALVPQQVQYFVSPNATGVNFMMPNSNGFQTINNNTLRYNKLATFNGAYPGIYLYHDISNLPLGDFLLMSI